jgi:cell division protein FtsA
MRKGLIAELGPAAEAINRAALTAERVARGSIETAVVGIGGTHVRGVNSRGGISMGSRMREITREEVRAAVDRARSVALPPDREVLHLLPQEFILDDQAGIHDPIGMVGNKLEVNLHLSTCSGGVAQSVVTCANRAGLEVQDTIYEGIAAAEAVLSARMSASWACAWRTSGRARRSWRCSSRARLRIRRCCRSAATTLPTTLRWGCMSRWKRRRS